jgi:hypothetical protein
MLKLSTKEAQLLGSLNQLLFEIRDDIPLDSRSKHLRMAINEADEIVREVSGLKPIQKHRG